MSGRCNLPEELQVNILLKLPLKTLVRFNSVCKSWNSIISNPAFIKTRLDRTAMSHHGASSSSSSFITYNFERVLVKGRVENIIPLPCANTSMFQLLHPSSLDDPVNLNLPFPHIPNPYEIEALASCNGLVLLRSLILSDSNNFLYLWNPATRKVKNISNFSKYTNSNSCFGLGFNQVTGDHMVVRIVCPQTRREIDLAKRIRGETIRPRLARRFRIGWESSIEVYSIREGFWRKIKVELGLVLENGYIRDYCDTIVKGLPYWEGRLLSDLEGRQIVSFDVHKEVFRLISLPDDISNNTSTSHRRLVEFKDSLAIMLCNKDISQNIMISLWVMDDDSGGNSFWTNKFTVGPFQGVKPLGCLSNGEIVVAKDYGEELTLYDPWKKVTKKSPISTCVFQFFNYIESLYSP